MIESDVQPENALSDWILGLDGKKFERLVAHRILPEIEPDAYQYTWTEYDRSGPEAWSKDKLSIVEVTTTDSNADNVNNKIKSDLDGTVWRYIRDTEKDDLLEVLTKSGIEDVDEYNTLTELKQQLKKSSYNKLDAVLSQYSIYYFITASKSDKQYNQQTSFDPEWVHDEFPMSIDIYGHTEIVDILTKRYQMFNRRGAVDTVEEYIGKLDQELTGNPRFKRDITRDDSDIRIRADLSVIHEIRRHLEEQFEGDEDSENILNSFVRKVERGPRKSYDTIDTSAGDSATLHIIEHDTFDAFVAYHYKPDGKTNRAEIVGVYPLT